MMNSKTRFLFTLFIFFVLISSISQAAYNGPKWSFGFWGGGGFGRTGAFQSTTDSYQFINGMGFFGYRFSDLFEMRFAGGVDYYYGAQEIVTWGTENVERDAMVVAFELDGIFHFFGNGDLKMDPYFMTGVRVLGINAIVGMGLNINLHKNFSVFSEINVSSSIFDSKVEGRGGVKLKF